MKGLKTARLFWRRQANDCRNFIELANCSLIYRRQVANFVDPSVREEKEGLSLTSNRRRLLEPRTIR
jgi:hypothetical protein